MKVRLLLYESLSGFRTRVRNPLLVPDLVLVLPPSTIRLFTLCFGSRQLFRVGVVF